MTEEKEHNERNSNRRSQIGSGMRADKVRTVQVKNNQVVDHRTKKKVSFKDYQRGCIEKLH